MTKKFVQDGGVINHTAASDISSGDVVAVGGRICVALADIATGKTGALATRGVFKLPKVTADDLAAGEKAYWDASESKIADSGTTPATGDISNCGVVVTAAGNGATEVEVDINAHSGTVN